MCQGQLTELAQEAVAVRRRQRPGRLRVLHQRVGVAEDRYNLFSWVYVLSHYDRAKSDPRFAEALALVDAKLVNGQIVPERVPRGLARLQFCKRGVPSALATRRYREIQANLAAPNPAPNHPTT